MMVLVCTQYSTVLENRGKTSLGTLIVGNTFK